MGLSEDELDEETMFSPFGALAYPREKDELDEESLLSPFGSLALPREKRFENHHIVTGFFSLPRMRIKI